MVAVPVRCLRRLKGRRGLLILKMQSLLKIGVECGQYRNAVASGGRFFMRSQLERPTRRYRVSVLTAFHADSDDVSQDPLQLEGPFDLKII